MQSPGKTLNVILSHQPATHVERMLRWWRELLPADCILLVHTGDAQEFEQVAHPGKLHVQDARLVTRDHQRELQSYSRVFAAACAFLKFSAFDYVHFCEFDQIPLVSDVNMRQIELLHREGADVLAFQLLRTDGTNHPHTLYHVGNPRFHRFWREITVRDDPAVVLSMFGSGSFWTRKAFTAVAEREEPFPMYLELYLPTVAHHLGFRVRDFGEQNRFISSLGDRSSEVEASRARGAWTLHPVKQLWTKNGC
jgi:hypothetical protein